MSHPSERSRWGALQSLTGKGCWPGFLGNMCHFVVSPFPSTIKSSFGKAWDDMSKSVPDGQGSAPQQNSRVLARARSTPQFGKSLSTPTMFSSHMKPQGWDWIFILMVSMEMSRKETRRPGDTLVFEIPLQPCLGESFLPSFSDFRLDWGQLSHMSFSL